MGSSEWLNYMHTKWLQYRDFSKSISQFNNPGVRTLIYRQYMTAI
jgi:hypothetical protein